MSRLLHNERRIPLWVYALCFAAALLLLPWIGAERVCWDDVASYLREGRESAGSLILFRQRIPRVLLSLLVGGALALAGAALQVLFRNPLAEPWTLGVAGGAAVGAFAAQAFQLHIAFIPLTSTQAFALAGAAAAMALVWTFSKRAGSLTPHTLLLAGVTLSVISGGVMMLLVYVVSPFAFISLHRWLMGGLDVLGYRELLSFLALAAPGLILLFAMANNYNHMAFNEELALGQGVDVARTRRLTFLAAGLVTAACVTVAGPIGFVGMIVPHIARRLSGFDHRIVLPAAFMLGGAILAVCDCLARTAAAPTEIPVGVITALIGGPIFLYILGKR